MSEWKPVTIEAIEDGGVRIRFNNAGVFEDITLRQARQLMDLLREHVFAQSEINRGGDPSEWKWEQTVYTRPADGGKIITWPNEEVEA